MPYVNSFHSELKELSNCCRQENQLDHITPCLDKLVKGNVGECFWHDRMLIDPRFMELIARFAELKSISNKIIHSMKTLT